MPTEPKALPPAILIAGVDQTRKTRAVGSLRIEYQLGARGRASLEILDQDSTETAYRPTMDQRLEVRSSDGRSLFRGTVTGVEDQPLGAPGVGTITQLDVVDDWFGAAQRRVSRTYVAGATLKSIVSDLVTTYLAVYGITLDPAMATGPSVAATTFDAISLEEAFNRLVDLSGWIYRLRPTGVIEWFAVGTKTRSFTLSAANKNILGPITWTKSRNQYANRIIVRYGTGLVGKQQLWHGNGTAVRFKPDYPPAWPTPDNHWIGWMTYVGGPYPGPPTPTVPPTGGGHEAISDISTGTAPWYWDATTGELVRHVGVPIPGGSAQVPASTHYFWLDYNVQYPLTVIAEAPSALTVPFEAFVERADIFDTAQAQAYANSQLAKYQVVPRTVALKTRAADDFLPGDTVRLDVPSRTLPNALWFVTEVQLTVAVDQAPIATLTLLEGTTAQASWLDFWRDIASSGSSVGIASGGSAPPPTSAGGSGTVSNYGDLTLNALVIGQGSAGIAPLPSGLGTLTTVLHGNPDGPPTFGPVNLSTEVIGTLPPAAVPPFDALAPTSVRGDLIGFDSNGSVRLPVGTAGKVLTVDFAAPTALSWQTPAAPIPPTPLPITTKGDLIGHNGTAPVRVSVGVDGQRLASNSAAPAGVSWVDGGLPDSPPLSVIGQPMNAPGPPTNIVAPVGSNYVLREDSGQIGFGPSPAGSGGTTGPLPDLGPTNVIDPVVIGVAAPAVMLLETNATYRQRLQAFSGDLRLSVNLKQQSFDFYADDVSQPGAVLDLDNQGNLMVQTSAASANPRRNLVPQLSLDASGTLHVRKGTAVIEKASQPTLQVSTDYSGNPPHSGDTRIFRGTAPAWSGNVRQMDNGDFWLDDTTKSGGVQMIVPSDGTLQYYVCTPGANPRPATFALTLNQLSAKFAGPLYERNRTTPMGEWINIPYSAAIFSASGSMTWTVVAGGIATLAYMLVGRTCYLFYNLSGTVGGTLSTDLYITLPFNATISSPGMMRLGLGTGATPWYSALSYFLVGQSKLGIQMALTTGTIPAGNIFVQGMAVCQV